MRYKIGKYLFWYSMPLIVIIISPILLIYGLFLSHKSTVKDEGDFSNSLNELKPTMINVGAHIAKHSWFTAIVQTIIIYQIWLK